MLDAAGCLLAVKVVVWVVVVVLVVVPAVLANASSARWARSLAAQNCATVHGYAATLAPPCDTLLSPLPSRLQACGRQANSERRNTAIKVLLPRVMILYLVLGCDLKGHSHLASR